MTEELAISLIRSGGISEPETKTPLGDAGGIFVHHPRHRMLTY
jgi:hypothetical protein